MVCAREVPLPKSRTHYSREDALIQQETILLQRTCRKQWKGATISAEKHENKRLLKVQTLNPNKFKNPPIKLAQLSTTWIVQGTSVTGIVKQLRDDKFWQGEIMLPRGLHSPPLWLRQQGPNYHNFSRYSNFRSTFKASALFPKPMLTSFSLSKEGNFRKPFDLKGCIESTSYLQQTSLFLSRIWMMITKIFLFISLLPVSTFELF